MQKGHFCHEYTWYNSDIRPFWHAVSNFPQECYLDSFKLPWVDLLLKRVAEVGCETGSCKVQLDLQSSVAKDVFTLRRY